MAIRGFFSWITGGKGATKSPQELVEHIEKELNFAHYALQTAVYPCGRSNTSGLCIVGLTDQDSASSENSTHAQVGTILKQTDGSIAHDSNQRLEEGAKNKTVDASPQAEDPMDKVRKNSQIARITLFTKSKGMDLKNLYSGPLTLPQQIAKAKRPPSAVTKQRSAPKA